MVMKRRYAKSSLNLTQTLEALRAGATISTAKDFGGLYDSHKSYGSFIMGGAEKYSAWPVDHRAMKALHDRNLLVRTAESTDRQTVWALKGLYYHSNAFTVVRDGDWSTARCTVTASFTPEDVYQGKVIALLAHVPSFLKVVAFRIPKDTDLFLSVFGYVLQPCWLFPPQDKPHFILDLNPNAEGNVVCPNCHHAGLLASWAPDTDHVGCPNCGWKVTNLVEKL